MSYFWSFLVFCCSLFFAAAATPVDASWRHLEENDDHVHGHITKSRNLAIASVVYGWIGCTFCVGAFVFVVVFRRKRVVALGQPPFLCLICVGSFLVAFVNLFENPETVRRAETALDVSSDNLCIAKMWFLDIGMVIVYMSFFCKLWRAEQVCQFRKKQVVHVRHVIGPFFFIVLIEIGILIGQTIVAPPFWSTEVPLYPHDPDKTGVIEKCYQYQLYNKTNMAFNAASGSVRLLCQFITLWMSFKTRKIREDITDSQRIFQAVVFQLILTVPYIFLVNGVLPVVGSVVYAFEFMYHFLLAVSSVGFLIIPKIHCVCYERRHGHLPGYARTMGVVHVSTTTTSSPTMTSLPTTTNTRNTI